MVIVAELKEIRWQGDSRKVAHRFPKGARNALGKELTRVQIGLQPRDGKWLTDIGPGVQEIRIPYDKEAYRVIYVARLAVVTSAMRLMRSPAARRVRAPSSLDAKKEVIDRG